MIRKKTSLKKRIRTLLVICFLPFVITMVYLLVLVYQFSGRYDAIVDKITRVNTYNINLKETVDYTMYVAVVNSERAFELVDLQEPYDMVASARSTFEDLSQKTSGEAIRSQTTAVIRTLNTLEKCMNEIMRDAKITGMYEKNLQRLDLNIRILTEIIQEQIQEYIFTEACNMQVLREQIGKDVSNALKISIGICFFTILCVMISGHKITDNLTRGIEQLRGLTRKAGKGDFTVRAQITEKDEDLMELEIGFNQMVERIGNLVEDIRIEQKNLRLTEQRLLQAQINPHFLYNTLDAIVWQAEGGENEQVVMMVTALSDFFRISLSKGRDFITVKEEESHIHSYLKIQQLRYQDIMDFEIAIAEELYPYQILKLTLQPLVENALYHGIKNKRGKGRIKVTGRLEENSMVFCVTDDGRGMTEERLALVRQSLQGKKDHKNETSGFGLFNVAQRIRLNYGSGYGLEVESVYGEGTRIKVRLPLSGLSS